MLRMVRKTLQVIAIFFLILIICSCSSLQYNDTEPTLSGIVPPVDKDTVEYGSVALKFLMNKNANILPSDFSSDNYIAFLSKPVKVRDSYEIKDHVYRLFNVRDENDYVDICLQSKVMTSANGLVICTLNSYGSLYVLDLDGNYASASLGDVYSNMDRYRRYSFDVDYEYPAEIQQLFNENIKRGELNLYSSALHYLEKRFDSKRIQVVYAHEGSYTYECIDSSGNSINVLHVGQKGVFPALGYGFRVFDPYDKTREHEYLIDSNGEVFQILPYEFYDFHLTSDDSDALAKENGFWIYDGKYINYNSELDLTTVVSSDYFRIINNDFALNGIYPILTYKNGLEPVLYVGIGFDCYDLTEEDIEKLGAFPFLLEYVYYNNFESKEKIDSITRITFGTGEEIDTSNVAFEYSCEDVKHKQYIKFYDISGIAASLLSNATENNHLVEEYDGGSKVVDFGTGYVFHQFLQAYLDVYADYINHQRYDLYAASGRYSLGSAKVDMFRTYDTIFNTYLSSNMSSASDYNYSSNTTRTYGSYYNQYAYSNASTIGNSVYSTFSDNTTSSISRIGNTFYSNSSSGSFGIITNIGNSYYASFSDGSYASASRIGNTLYSSYSDGTFGSSSRIGNTVYSSFSDGVFGTSSSIGNMIYSSYSDGSSSTTYKIGNTYYTSYY